MSLLNNMRNTNTASETGKSSPAHLCATQTLSLRWPRQAGDQNGCLLNLTGHCHTFLTCVSAAGAVPVSTRKTEEEDKAVASGGFSIC